MLTWPLALPRPLGSGRSPSSRWRAGLTLGAADAIHDAGRCAPPRDVWAAGNCVHTHHQLTGEATYLPLGTTAHKQGRVAGENVLGGNVEYVAHSARRR